MKNKNLMLFAYDFPHKKTQDFIIRLFIEGYNIKYVIASPWKKLNIPSGKIKTDPKHVGLIHPKLICKKLGIRYLVSDHDTKKTADFIKKNQVDIAIISGARILNKETIEACQNRVLNIHPGLLPDVRGLDTFLWSIYYKKPLGITAHFITPKIDSGLLIYQEKLPLYKNDTPIDVNLRLLEYQTDILIKSLNLLKKTKINQLKNLSILNTPYNTKMDHALEEKTYKKFPNWLNTFSHD